MRLGLFCAIFGALLCTLAIGAPIPIGPRPVAGGQPPAPGDPPRCLLLGYERGHQGGSLPATMRLLAEAVTPDGRWYRAKGGPDRRYQHALWRPAGMDSIDIVWHHSRVLRLATRGDTLRGRAAPSYVGNLLGAMLESDFAVAAVRVECE